MDPKSGIDTNEKNLSVMSVEELGILFPIRLEEARAGWEEIFHNERVRIVNVLHCSNVAGVEHIGSTAIPDIMAKPTVDLLLILERESSLDNIVSGMEDLGYYYIPKPENPAPHMMFVKGYTKHGFEGQAFHVHARYPGEQDEVVFRDYLINNPDIAVEYEMLKIELAAKFRHDRDAYTEGKGEFVARVLREARVTVSG
ncbi:MAG: GrpB family protein [Bacteroidetes bacterium]|nr:GrpB family protein [Bacteroidota bacterium]